MYNRRLREQREDNDLTQKQIAERLKITYQQYQLYETGKRQIPIDKFKELCKFYNVSADYMLGLTNEYRKLR